MYEGIMAGVDRSPSATDAALWAAGEADLRGLRLELVHAAPPPSRSGRAGEEDGRELLEATVALVGESFPHVKVTPVLVRGNAPVVLAREASRIGFAVLGRPGPGAPDGTPAARTAFQIAGHVHCPVLVVPEGQGGRRPGDVVAGVDGSTNAARALRFAFEEAALRGTRLRVVHVHHGLAASMGPATAVRMPDRIRRLSAATLMGSHAAYPEVDVMEEAYRGDPHEIMLKLGEEAGLLVVGSRGLGDGWGRAFGSVSRPILHRARCPLAVVRR